MMHQERHPDLRLIHLVPQAFEEGVVIVEARVNLLNRANDAALIRFSRIASTRTSGIAV
jgi:hypothetical protein